MNRLISLVNSLIVIYTQVHTQVDKLNTCLTQNKPLPLLQWMTDFYFINLTYSVLLKPHFLFSVHSPKYNYKAYKEILLLLASFRKTNAHSSDYSREQFSYASPGITPDRYVDNEVFPLFSVKSRLLTTLSFVKLESVSGSRLRGVLFFICKKVFYKMSCRMSFLYCYCEKYSDGRMSLISAIIRVTLPIPSRRNEAYLLVVTGQQNLWYQRGIHRWATMCR